MNARVHSTPSIRLLLSPFRTTTNALFMDIYLSPVLLSVCTAINDIGDTMQTNLGVLDLYICNHYLYTPAAHIADPFSFWFNHTSYWSILSFILPPPHPFLSPTALNDVDDTVDTKFGVVSLHWCNEYVRMCVFCLQISLSHSAFRATTKALFMDIYLAFFRPLTPPYQLFRCLFA